MILKEASKVLQIEADGILNLIDRLDKEFEAMVTVILNADGRVIVSGIGKSGIIARKISATLNSTSTRSLVLHPVEAMNGDLGMVSPDGSLELYDGVLHAIDHVGDVTLQDIPANDYLKYFGEGVDSMKLADRATLANMGPEYGATMGFFPTDTESLNYLRRTGRPPELVELVERHDGNLASEQPRLVREPQGSGLSFTREIIREQTVRFGKEGTRVSLSLPGRDCTRPEISARTLRPSAGVCS